MAKKEDEEIEVNENLEKSENEAETETTTNKENEKTQGNSEIQENGEKKSSKEKVSEENINEDKTDEEEKKKSDEELKAEIEEKFAQSKKNGDEYQEKRREEHSKMKKHHHKKKKSKFKRFLKGLLIFCIVLIILLAIFVGAAWWYINSKINKLQYVPINKDDLSIETVVKEDLEDYRNIAILGIDARADTYSEGNRSDGIIIASINEKTNEIKLTSVYRDTYVDIDGHGLDKLTHAYSYGGPQLALKTLNKNFDLNIEEFVAVNFDAVKEIVDSVGGISMPITAEEAPHIKGIDGPGTYVLSGEKALAYARIRYAEGGDYKRTERMREVLTGVFNKVKNFNARQMNSFIDTTFPKIYTNIRPDEIRALIPKAAQFKIVNSIGWPYNVKGITLDRWYGVPVTLEANVVRLHKEIFNQEDYVVSDTVKQISDSIVAKTGYAE